MDNNIHKNVTCELVELPLSRKMIYLIFLLISSFINLSVCDEFAPIDHVSFLDESTTPQGTPPGILGSYPHDCVGNIHHCPDGFTITLHYKADPGDPDIPYRYILSSGGQSPLSEGWYFRRNYGREHEIGVGIGDKIWAITFFVEENRDMSIAFTWDDELTVFVDSILVSRQTPEENRLWTEPNLDLFPQITVGKSNTDIRDDDIHGDVQVANVEIRSGVLNSTQIEQAVATEFLEIGCVTQLSQVVLDTVHDVSTSSNINHACRSSCSEKDEPTAYIQESSCFCGEEKPEDLNLVSCSDNTFQALKSSHISELPDTWATELAVDVIRPTSHAYIRPDETVTFVITTTGPEETTLIVDFKDGITRVLPGGNKVNVSHAWSSDGTYNVNITAVSRTIVESHFTTVEIQYVEEGQSPEEVHVKSDTVYKTSKVGLVEVYMDAFSPKTKNCILQLSPEETLPFEDLTDLIFSTDKIKQYSGIGMFNVSFTCSNDFGVSGDWQLAVSANPVLLYEHYPRGLDINIPVLGADVPSNNLLVYIDDRDETSQMTITKDHLKVDEAVFPNSGEHMIMLKSSGKTLLSKIFNLQQEVENLNIDSHVIHAHVNETLEFTFKIGEGDFMHVLLDFGDGTEETLFIPVSNGPVTIHRNHSYSTLGKYDIDIHVANDVSAKSFRHLVSIERPLVSATMSGINVTNLGEPTVFSFLVDMFHTPAMPVTIIFDYDNGVDETVMLGSQRDRASVLRHSYVYPDYGIYRVKAEVSNNISSIPVNALVQVGENITTVDVYVDKDKGVIRDVFTFTVKCPRGSPIFVDLEMGDGETIHATRGVVDTPTIEPDTNKSMEDPGKQSQARAKRSVLETTDTTEPTSTQSSIADIEQSEVTYVSTTATPTDEETLAEFQTTVEAGPRPTLPPNEDFVLTYEYKSPGTYSVKVVVHNRFSSTESYLCPEITVAAVDQSKPTCNSFEVDIDSASTEDNPLVKMRSEVINIPTTKDISCDSNWERRFTPRYTWKTQWRTPYDKWRPELEVCHSEMMQPTLTIPSNTLWYGTYKLSVTMTFRTLQFESRRRRSLGNKTIVSTLRDTAPTLETTLDIETTHVALDDVGTTAASHNDSAPIDEDLDPWQIIMEMHQQREEERQNIIDELSRTRATMIKSTSKTTYLKITPSPLVADIFGWDTEEVNNFVKSDVIKANLNVSYDPDVIIANKTGMTMHLFCYVGKSRSMHEGKNLDQLIQSSSMLSTNLAKDVFVYNTDACYNSLNGTAVFENEINIVGSDLNMEDDLIFDLIITKDTRVGRTVREAHVYSTTISADALDNIDFDNIDVNAALTIISLVVGDGGGAQSEVLTKVVNVMDKVANRIENMDQLDKTAGVMGTVTGANGLTKDAKATAASALGNTAGKAQEVGKKASLDQMTNIGGSLIGGVGNVLPFAEPEDDEEDEIPPTPPPMMTSMAPTMAATTAPPGVENTAVTSRPQPGGSQSTVDRTGTGGSGDQDGDQDSQMRLMGLNWDIPTTETPEFECKNYTKEQKKEIKKKITARRPKPPEGNCAIPTVAGLKREAPCDPEFDEDCEDDTPYSFCCTNGCEVCEQEPKCCEMQEGLCKWVSWIQDPLAGDCDYWANVECNAMHPDDMEWLREKYDEAKLAEKKKKFATRKKTTTNGMKACSGIGQVIGGKQSTGSDINLQTDKMKVTLSKNKKSEASSMDGGVSASAGDPEEDVSAMNMESENPFTYSDTADEIKSKVKTREMTDAKGKPIKVENATEPIIMWIEGQPDRLPPPGNHTLLTTENVDWEYHSLKLVYNDSSMHIVVIPVNPNDKYHIAIKYEDYPNDTYYDWRGTIPVDPDSLGPESEWPEDIRDLPNIKDLLLHTAFPDPKITNNSGVYKIAIKMAGRLIDYDNPTNESDYSMEFFQSGCRFFNESTDNWESGGMEVGKFTSKYKTQCLTSHLTSFGGDFVVPPNTIDFKTVFSLEKFLESMPVFITVIVVLVLYVGVLIWARHHDKKDLVKWGAAPLEDNLPTDQYHYQLTVYTGTKKQAHTKSRVSFILSGDNADTGCRRLFDGKRKEFVVGSINNYVLSTEGCLGPLTYLRIWHDNSGSGKKRSWFCDQVQVTDLQTGDKFFFLCNRWLAVEQDDGAIDRILPVAGMKDLSAFKQLFNTSVRKKLTNDHLWFSVVSRPTRSSFTRVQRVSVCVSLLFLTMITNCMFFKADEGAEKVSSLTIGPFSFTLHQLFISIVSTAIVFPPSIFIVTVFRRARPKKNAVMQMNQNMAKKSKKFQWRTFNPGSSLWSNYEKSKAQKFKDSMKGILSFHQKSKYSAEGENAVAPKKRKKKSWSLPHWMVYIAWIICILSIVASGFFTILYSMEWGKVKSMDWLTTFLLSFFQSVAVIQPIKVLLLAAFISCVMRKPELEEEEEDLDEPLATAQADAEVRASQINLQEVIQQRKMGMSELAPPDTASLEEARKLRMQEMQMEAVLKECIVYIFFLLVIFFLSYQARDSDSFNFSQNIKNTFFSSTFENIKKPADVWKFLYGSFLPNLYSSTWYNGRPLDWREALQIDDRATIRVGVARMRTQRIKDDMCKVQKDFRTLIHHCRDEYSWTNDDAKDYLPGWQLPPEGNETLVFEDEKSSWVYRNSIELKTPPYTGTITTYKGGGYTLVFARSKTMTEVLIKELQANDWIDVNTRVVMLEFTLYNANVNLFGSVIMMVEFMSTGAAVTRAEVKAFRVSSYIGGFAVIVIFFEVCFLIFTVYFLIKMAKDIRKERLKYFKDFWNMLEFATIMLSLISIAMYAMKKVFATVAINTLHESCSGDYVNFVSISIWDEVFTMMLGLVVFLATIKFVKMLKFNKRMGMLGDTIKLATKDLKYFSATFFIYFAAFCMLAYVLFGKELPSYGSFIGAIEALFAFALGSFDFYEFQAAQPFLGPIFFFAYVAIVNIGLMGMFLTIIYDAFATVKANSEHQSNDYEIVEFIMGKFKGVFGWS